MEAAYPTYEDFEKRLTFNGVECTDEKSKHYKDWCDDVEVIVRFRAEQYDFEHTINGTELIKLYDWEFTDAFLKNLQDPEFDEAIKWLKKEMPKYLQSEKCEYNIESNEYA